MKIAESELFALGQEAFTCYEHDIFLKLDSLLELNAYFFPCSHIYTLRLILSPSLVTLSLITPNPLLLSQLLINWSHIDQFSNTFPVNRVVESLSALEFILLLLKLKNKENRKCHHVGKL